MREEIDAAYIVYNEFKSVIQQRLVVEKLLPLIKIGAPQITGATEPTAEEKERAAEAALSAGIELEPADTHEAEEEAKKFGTANVDYIYEQPPEELFAGLLPQYIFAMLYHAMTESVAAEHAARMTAMDSATNNASDMIDSLTLHMNRVRQAAITKEIIEIVSRRSGAVKQGTGSKRGNKVAAIERVCEVLSNRARQVGQGFNSDSLEQGTTLVVPNQAIIRRL